MQHRKDELSSIIKDAEKLHGHLGPFLVIGVRMGDIAKKTLGVSDESLTMLRAKAKIPLTPPFSCLLDGIQTTTTCTLGNQRLTTENSERIAVDFETQTARKKLRISLSPPIMEMLKKKISEGPLTEDDAWEIAGMPENQLFIIKMQ